MSGARPPDDAHSEAGGSPVSGAPPPEDVRLQAVGEGSPMTAVVQAVDEADLARRFGGLERLYGVAGAKAIRTAHVLVVGIGGVGSWAVEALARSGVGRLTLVDMDHVSESNINRQIHALSTTVGQSKVLAMRDRIALIHPGCEVVCIDDFVTADNWLSLVPNGVDAVIDACDQVQAKTAMAAWALAHQHRFITVGAAGGKRLAHLVEIDDLSLATHDPLLAQVRQRLRKHHGAPQGGKRMRVQGVFSREPVAPPDPSCAIEGDGSLNCHGYGSVVSVTATFGQCAAGWVLDSLARGL
jgi:tRNA A37 threonylcarbamoyladenosine dehydratase